eukprot:TRINITY_DN2086_c0_g5_i4.p1 TRINITY_DN2086_c0_g5~~TRINITY_DN2086_c0_g5_i4.p1  ORF type:complete len:119 (-),score=9.83 TRINITY_DN2086_c0_g5_i4:65-421(-)
MVDPKFRVSDIISFSGIKFSLFSPHYARLVFGVYQSCPECTAIINQLEENERVHLAKISNSSEKMSFHDYIIEENVFQNLCSLSKVRSLKFERCIFQPLERFLPNLEWLSLRGFQVSL